MKTEIIKHYGRSHSKNVSQKEWQDANNAKLIKIAELSEKAIRLGGSLSWTGEITEDGGFVMGIKIDI